jgi:hypothetical protein
MPRRCQVNFFGLFTEIFCVDFCHFKNLLPGWKFFQDFSGEFSFRFSKNLVRDFGSQNLKYFFSSIQRNFRFILVHF